MAVKLVCLDHGSALFWCPACGKAHGIRVGDNGWSFNGDVENPTTEPSIKVSNAQGTICHCYLKDGKIRFCGDSPHVLAGQTVDLPDFPKSHHIHGYEWNSEGQCASISTTDLPQPTAH